MIGRRSRSNVFDWMIQTASLRLIEVIYVLNLRKFPRSGEIGRSSTETRTRSSGGTAIRINYHKEYWKRLIVAASALTLPRPLWFRQRQAAIV